MHDAATITLILTTLALLRWSLLSPSDADSGIRGGEEGKHGSKILVPVVVRTARPHVVHRRKTGTKGF
jgi:hypothetical protein